MGSFPGKEEGSWIRVHTPAIESKSNSRSQKDRVPGHLALSSLKLPASALPGVLVSNAADSWASPHTTESHGRVQQFAPY